MAQTASTMLPLGTSVPEFRLKATNFNNDYSYNSVKGDKGTLVIFICNHCPFVIHVIEEIGRIANYYRESGIRTVAISSNDAEKYPQDGPQMMAQFASKKHINFPYLYDESQEVAKAFDAACTTDFFLFDSDAKLFYRGQLDDSRPDNGIPVTGNDLRHAIDALIADRKQEWPQKPSIGCNIKWK